MIISPKFSIFHMNFDSDDTFPVIKKVPEFYMQVLINYNKSKPDVTDSVRSNPGDQIIWGNKAFLETTQNGKKTSTLYFKYWIQSGLIYVKNLKFINGQLDENYIYNKVQNKTNIYIEIHLLKKAMRPYQQYLNQILFTEDLLDADIANIQISNPTLSVTKHFYDKIISKFKQSASLNKWGEVLNMDISQEMKVQIFDRKVCKIKENKIKEFNYKVLHNILACNNLLSKWVTDNDGRCEICQEKDDIYHLIFKCDLAQMVWNLISIKTNTIINDKDVIFGTCDSNFNYCLSFTAFSIHRRIQRGPTGPPPLGPV